ncbi:MAG: RuBisCO accumulation factor 1 [Thainema sp.]
MADQQSNTPNPENPQSPAQAPNESNIDVDELVLLLRRKQGQWVDWGQACQALQKAGYSPQRIFEETGFEPVQQNQVIVGAQVFQSLVAAGVADQTRSHFGQKGSDILYELRILSQTDRAKAAELIVNRGLEFDDAHELAKAMKDYSWRTDLPEGFGDNAGDAFAYWYWRLARQSEDLQARSRLIAQALRFVHSERARQEIEKLLLDFAPVASKPKEAPRLPVYRLEEMEELPRIVPVAGEWPISVDDYKAVPLVDEDGEFRVVQFSGSGAWVPLPGWQVVLNAEDPVALLAQSDQMPTELPGKTESILLLIDRAQRQWQADSYFVVDADNQLQLQWFSEAPQVALLGRLVLLLRPQKVLDEEYTTELWQLDE